MLWHGARVGQILRVPEVLHISCNTGTRALPDMSALALRRCAPSGVVRTYQAMHSCLCYNYYMYVSAWYTLVSTIYVAAMGFVLSHFVII